ncbi:hypothetical protein [Streptomyces sp. NPDC020951]|uniref:hypothetical protein n=1 Tax=Streptomyces sp. NPDC020951 TaxID=3365104 RepID=UPI0037A6B24A
MGALVVVDLVTLVLRDTLRRFNLLLRNGHKREQNMTEIIIRHKQGRGGKSASQVQKMVREVLSEIDGDVDLQQEIRNQGVDPTALSPDAVNNVRQVQAGTDPATLSLIITLVCSFAGPPVRDVWRYVLLPRIRDRWGKDVIGDEEDGGT